MGRCFHVQDFGPPPRQSRRYRGEKDRWFCRVPGIIRELGGAMIEYGDGLPNSDDKDFREVLRIESEQLSDERAKHLANITPRDAGLQEDSTEDEDDDDVTQQDNDVTGLQQDDTVVGGYTWVKKNRAVYLTKPTGYLEDEEHSEHSEDDERSSGVCNYRHRMFEEYVEKDDMRSSGHRNYRHPRFATLPPHPSP